MEQFEWIKLRGFYENELTNHILSFWLSRCEDYKNGGYFNCFDNTGEHLISKDKYTWSQARFVWIFAKLADEELGVFSKSERENFLRLSQSGCEFLMKHCLLGENDWRCVYLMEANGSPKHVEQWEPLDMSIYADCFVVLGMAAFATVSGRMDSYEFAKKLYASIIERIHENDFHTLPYPLSKKFRAHGIPMILLNVTKELYDAALKLESSYVETLTQYLEYFADDILIHFTDENNTIHEVISSDNQWVDGLLGQHANPGHTIEDMWFMFDAAEILKRPDIEEKALHIVLQALENGWDSEYGGILHYCDIKGGIPSQLPSDKNLNEVEEPTVLQVVDGWSDKLWWVHSEALYTTLRCYAKTGDNKYLNWHNRIFEYTFRVFPNTNPEIREWKQILQRNGESQEKVVALPVKDPFHITRNLILILKQIKQELR